MISMASPKTTNVNSMILIIVQFQSQARPDSAIVLGLNPVLIPHHR